MDPRDATVTSRIRDRLGAEKGVSFAVAFGSSITADSHASSDIDIAVKFADELDAVERFRRLCVLSAELQESGKPFVDLSDIDELPIGVAYDAVNGQLVYGNERRFEEVKTHVETRFEQERADIQERHRSIIDRVAEDGLHG